MDIRTRNTKLAAPRAQRLIRDVTPDAKVVGGTRTTIALDSGIAGQQNDHDRCTRPPLQTVLDDLIDLHVRGVEAHAHFIGTPYYGMHRQLEALVHIVREATRLVQELGGTHGPACGGRRAAATTSPVIAGLRPAQRCTTAAVKMLSHKLTSVLDGLRSFERRFPEADPSALALLETVAGSLEEQAHLLAAESYAVASTTRTTTLPSAADLIDPPNRALRLI